jgi:HEPN domain-containing protein
MSDDEDYAREWFSFALGDLRAARAGRGAHMRPRIVAFHAQQAAEKALKAALVLEGIRPPASHDLEELRRKLPTTWKVHGTPADLSRLGDYGVDAKYPDNAIQVRPIDAAVAVRQAMAVVRHVRDELERQGVRTDDLRPA